MPAGSILPLEMNRIHYDEVLLTGTFGFGPPDFRKAVELISSGKLDVMRLVTASVPLEATLDDGKACSPAGLEDDRFLQSSGGGRSGE